MMNNYENIVLKAQQAILGGHVPIGDVLVFCNENTSAAMKSQLLLKWSMIMDKVNVVGLELSSILASAIAHAPLAFIEVNQRN